MTLKLMTPEHAASVAALYEDIRRDTVPVVHSVGEIAEWLITTRIARSSSYVLETDGLIVGWVDVMMNDLDQLYVRRGYTSRGYGLRLLNFAKSLYPGGGGSLNEEGHPDVKMVWAP